jgi:hypothetical protein
MASKNSLEFAVETYFVELFRTDKKLKGKKIVHSDYDGPAESDAVVVEAIQGDPPLIDVTGRDVAGHNLNVRCEYKGNSKADFAQNDMIASAMSQSVMAANDRKTTAQDQFAILLLLNEQMSSERPDTRNTRIWVLKLPIIAKLKPN